MAHKPNFFRFASEAITSRNYAKLRQVASRLMFVDGEADLIHESLSLSFAVLDLLKTADLSEVVDLAEETMKLVWEQNSDVIDDKLLEKMVNKFWGCPR